MENTDLNTSWISGKHSDTIEIDTAHSIVVIGDFFVQGEEADKIIEEIHFIWVHGYMTALEACEKWADMYLNED